MLRLFSILFLFIYTFILFNCSQNEDTILQKEINVSPDSLYKIAMNDVNQNKYDDASINFKKIINQFPLSNEGIQSQIMLAFIDYLKLDYTNAIYKFDKIINFYPSHKNIDYVLYMKAICYYEQINKAELDGGNAHKALEYFNKLINSYPESEYSRDSQQKIILINENIASKNMDIGLFYLSQKKYLAALNRYNIVVNKFSKTKYTPEALFRLVEIYYILGMLEDAKKTASIISFNYPDSKWYKYAYNLLVAKKDENNSFMILNKISNLLNNNEDKK